MITERILSPDLAGCDFTQWVLTTQTNYSAMQDGTFNGERTQRAGNISTSTFIGILHVYRQDSQARMYRQHVYRQSKQYNRICNENVQSLIQVYLIDGATTCIQKKRNGHPQRQGWQTGSVDPMWRGAGMTELAHETDASYPHPRGATVGRSRRLVPTATRTAAPGLRPHNDGQVVTPSPHGH